MILSDAGTPARKANPGAGKSARITSSLLSTLMFLHKFRRTFIAMFWGWVVCNLVTLVFAVAIEWRRDFGSFSRLGHIIAEMIYWYIGTAIVIFIAWLVVFFPVDLIVPDRSRVRRPKSAVWMGFLAGYMALFIPCVVIPYIQTGTLQFNDDLIVMSLLGGLTGLTAALHVVLKHPRITA